MKKGPKTKPTTRTTYDRLMQSESFRKKLEEEERKLEISEMLVELMEKENLSIRELAKKADVSATVIQSIRNGENENPTLAVLSRLLHTLGAEIVFKKGKKILATV